VTTTTPVVTETSTRLPDGFTVRLRDDVLRFDDSRALVGGSPARAVRLAPRAQTLLAHGRLTVDGPATAALARRLLDGNLADPVLDGPPVPAAELTIVIPVRGRPEQLDRCLASLAPLRVIVVDDASHDPGAIATVARRHDAALLPLTTNRGPAGARNAGLAQVTTPLVAFVDSDVEIPAAALLDLARHCHDPQVALVGPRVKGATRSRRPHWFERYDTVASSLDLGPTGGRVTPGAAVGWLPSACLVGRVAHIRGSDIDGFDATWRVAEDVDLVWRLIDAGLTVRYDPTTQARHDVRTSMRGWLGRKVVYGTGGADLAHRHGDKVAPAVLSPTMAIAAAALLQRRWWSLPLAALAAARTTRALAGRLPLEQGRTTIAASLTLRGTGCALRQETGLLLRHWWPLTAIAAPFSRPVRRALITAVLVDLAVSLREHPGIDPLTTLAGRRLDDLAYGTGLWHGALRSRSLRCVTPRRAGSTAEAPSQFGRGRTPRRAATSAAVRG